MFTVELNNSAEDIAGFLEFSGDLVHWQASGESAITARTPTDGGFSRAEFSVNPPEGAARGFLRFRIDLRPHTP